jgi:organic hydroperoxide reductase OsmC/OhrA
VSSGSGALAALPMTWASRTERPDGKTSPEELIAAAHAGCFAMASRWCSARLARRPSSSWSAPPARLTRSAAHPR